MCTWQRFRKKGRMLCTCPASQSLSPVLNVEHLFLNHVQDGAMVPFAISPGKARGFLFPGICNSCAVFLLSLGTFVKEAFSDLCPEISSSKIGGQFGLAPLKAFGVHLNSGCKTALWTIFIQLNLCDRMSTTCRAWKPDWNLILTWISGGARRAFVMCLKGFCLQKKYTGGYWSRFDMNHNHFDGKHHARQKCLLSEAFALAMHVPYLLIRLASRLGLKVLFGGLEHFPYIGNNHPNWLSYFSDG